MSPFWLRILIVWFLSIVTLAVFIRAATQNDDIGLQGLARFGLTLVAILVVLVLLHRPRGCDGRR